jgi:hypothetical protein
VVSKWLSFCVDAFRSRLAGGVTSPAAAISDAVVVAVTLHSQSVYSARRKALRFSESFLSRSARPISFKLCRCCYVWARFESGHGSTCLRWLSWSPPVVLALPQLLPVHLLQDYCECTWTRLCPCPCILGHSSWNPPCYRVDSESRSTARGRLPLRRATGRAGTRAGRNRRHLVSPPAVVPSPVLLEHNRAQSGQRFRSFITLWRFR